MTRFPGQAGYTLDSIHIFLRQSIMLKADIALFNALASSDEAVRIEAATKLEQRPHGHFEDHPTGKLLRRLMQDRTVQHEALDAAKYFPDLGPEDYEILLDMENRYAACDRVNVQKLMAKLEATVPGCRREALPRASRCCTPKASITKRKGARSWTPQDDGAAIRSLYDQGLKKDFLAKMPLPPLNFALSFSLD
ncbi:MAG: hypothetical protein LBB55_02730 [Zoogloeaceae bacterium]|nr:hypothetical protein [Zoogloeaceae bacterium]